MVLHQYSQITHDDSKHSGSAKRDTANGVAGLDVSKEIINNVPVANLVNIDEQSFTNLLKNGDFESWSAGGAAAPDAWGVTADVVSRSTTVKHGAYSVSILNTAASAGSVYKTIIYTDHLYRQGRTFTLGCWVKADTASRVRLELNDHTAAGWDQSYSSYHSGGGGWEWLTVTRTYRLSLTDNMYLSAQCVAGAAITFYVDGAIFVEGSVCPAFSPKPLVDDGKTLQVDSNTNTVSVGGKLVMTCTPQILTGAGAISVESCITHLVTGGAGADAITLADGLEGQEKIILIKTLTAGGDTSVVTPAHFAHGTTFTGNQAGSIQNLIFTNGSWHWTGGRNTVIA